MTKKLTLVEQMRSNPAKGWTMGDVIRLCRLYGITLEPPTRGSHYKVSSRLLDWHLTVPFHRPIKAVYIRALVALIDEHVGIESSTGKEP